jgi:ribosomal protein L23
MKAPTVKGKAKTVKAAEPKKKAKTLTNFSLKPRVSEKAYGLSEARNVFTFDVEAGVNKFDIARAVESQYDVTAVKVRMVTLPGKSLTRYKDRGRKSFKGERSGVRKAYVTLKEGDKLPIFAGLEEPSAKPEKEKK